MQFTQTCPGPGDSVTWGPPTGHPLDPRTDDDDELEAIKRRLEADPATIRNICGDLPENIWDEWSIAFSTHGAESASDVLANAVFAEIEAMALREQAKSNERAAAEYAADRYERSAQ